MEGLRGSEWIILLVLGLLLFGGFKKMPEAARGLGRSLRIFKAEIEGMSDQDMETDTLPTDVAGVGTVAHNKELDAA